MELHSFFKASNQKIAFKSVEWFSLEVFLVPIEKTRNKILKTNILVGIQKIFYTLVFVIVFLTDSQLSLIHI